MPAGDDNDRSLAHRIRMVFDQVAHGDCFFRSGQTVQPHDAGVRKPTQKNEFPEVLVLGDKYAVFLVCEFKQFLVPSVCVSAAGRKDIVPEVG